MAPLVVLLPWLLLAQPAAEPVCGEGEGEVARRALLAAINAGRLAAGEEPLEPHPALCEVARWRSLEAARRGSPDADARLLEETTRRLLRAGYRAHDWRTGTLFGSWEGDTWAQWREVAASWTEEIVRGDYEVAGIGLAEHEGQPVYTVLVALAARTVEWRHAKPLGDLAWVRSEILQAVNEARRLRGRRPLAADERLDAAAQAHAEDQLERSYYDHESPEGEAVRQRVERAGAGHLRRVGENIAKGLFDPQEAVRRWLESSGHRRNILYPRFSRLGVGVAFGENENGFEVIWVQVFGG